VLKIYGRSARNMTEDITFLSVKRYRSINFYSTMEILYVPRIITLYLLLVLYSGPLMDWFNPKKCLAKANRKRM